MVLLASRRRRAIVRRIPERGMRCSAPGGAGDEAAFGRSEDFCSVLAAEITSPRTMRPPGPDPEICCNSTPNSAATLRASGEAFGRDWDCSAEDLICFEVSGVLSAVECASSLVDGSLSA